MNEECESPPNLGRLIGEVTRFTDAYESFLRNATRETTLGLVVSGKELTDSLLAYSTLAQLVSDRLERPVVLPSPDYQELRLLVTSEPRYEEIVLKFTAIRDLYLETCNLLDVSASEYPLEVIDLEAGSLWFRVFGESRVIKLVTRFIEKGAGYLYRRFTIEGQIASIPRQIDAVEAVFELSKSLEEVGVDTTIIKDRLQKSGVIISSRLSDLLEGAPSVTVNDQEFSVGDALTQKYISESKTLLLGEGNETNGKDMPE